MRYFYLLNEAVDTPETGYVYPQIQEYGGRMNSGVLDSFRNVRYSELPKFQPNLDYLVLHPQAKLTDLVSSSFLGKGLIISRKFADLFRASKLAENKFCEARIQVGDQKFDYYWLLQLSDCSSMINYNESEFWLYHRIQRKIVDEICFASHQAFSEFQSSLDQHFGADGKFIAIKPKVLRMSKLFYLQNWDYFMLRDFGSNNYISKDLAALIAANGITGITV